MFSDVALRRDRIRQNRFDQKIAPNPCVSLRNHSAEEDNAK